MHFYNNMFWKFQTAPNIIIGFGGLRSTRTDARTHNLIPSELSTLTSTYENRRVDCGPPGSPSGTSGSPIHREHVRNIHPGIAQGLVFFPIDVLYILNISNVSCIFL